MSASACCPPSSSSSPHSLAYYRKSPYPRRITFSLEPTNIHIGGGGGVDNGAFLGGADNEGGGGSAWGGGGVSKGRSVCNGTWGGAAMSSSALVHSQPMIRSASGVTYSIMYMVRQVYRLFLHEVMTEDASLHADVECYTYLFLRIVRILVFVSCKAESHVS